MPPPCDEFTTSDPFFSATRVSPPGGDGASPAGETSTKGLQIHVARRQTLARVKIGTVDRLSVGCAM